MNEQPIIVSIQLGITQPEQSAVISVPTGA